MLRAMQPVLEELLLRARLVDAQRMRKAKDIAADTGCTLAHALVKMGFVSDRGLAALLSQALSLRVVDPTRADADALAIATLAGSVAYRLRVLPLRLRSTADGEFVFLAMSDPSDRDAVREVEACTGREVVPAVAEERALERALRQHYAREGLKPVPARPALDDDDPPLVVGVLDVPATTAPLEGARDDDVRAQLLANDDGAYFTESTEELMTVYSRALARAERGSDDRDLMWLQERRELASGADEQPVPAGVAPSTTPPAAWPPKPTPSPVVASFEDVRTAPLSSEKLAALSAPPAKRTGARSLGAVPFALPPEEERTQPDLRPALAEAKRELFRPPTCVVADDLELRSLLGVGLAGYLADLHVEPSLYDALVLGDELPLGYVVVIAPRADPGVVREIQRVSEMAGAPRVLVAGGDPAFQVVPGVAHWIDLLAVGKERLPDAILEALARLEEQAIDERGLERS